MKDSTKRHKLENRSLDLFSVFDYYAPNIKGTVALLLMFLIGAFLANLLMVGIQMIGNEGLKQYSDLISYPVLFIPAMIYASNKGRLNSLFDPPVKFDANYTGQLNWWILVPLVMVMTIAGNFITDPLQKLLPETPEWFEQLMESMLTEKPLWATLLSVSVFAPIFEEWLCRGMILRGLMKTKMGPAWAIAVSALIFAVIHLNPWQALPAFILGILFGYVYYRTRSLKLTMLMHCTNNTFAAILGQNEALLEMSSFSEVMSTGLYVSLVALSVVLVAAAVVILQKKVPAYEDGPSA